MEPGRIKAEHGQQRAEDKARHRTRKRGTGQEAPAKRSGEMAARAARLYVSFVPEESLLERARQGNLAAFNVLVDEHQGLVFNVCLRILGDWAAAEDAAQEAFVSAWRNLSGLKGDRFRPWLLRIASNACLDELRRRGRRPAASLDSALDEGLAHPADPDPAPEEAALSAELRSGIEVALLHLPQDQRLAVVLCDVQGLEYEEIAQVMRTSIGTVKSRLSRGRARLRKELLSQPELLPAHFRPRSGEPT